MNKKIITVGLALILALTVFCGSLTTAAAKGGNGANITQLPWARLPAADSGLAIDLWTTEEAWQIETPSGNVILIAHFDIPEEYCPEKALTNSGFLVTTWAAGNTYDTKCVVTPGGRATLQAIIKHNSE